MGTSTLVKTASLSLSSMETYKNTRINLPMHNGQGFFFWGGDSAQNFCKKESHLHPPTSDDAAFCWGCWTWWSLCLQLQAFLACPNY
jgi:hypothetical protein